MKFIFIIMTLSLILSLFAISESESNKKVFALNDSITNKSNNVFLSTKCSNNSSNAFNNTNNIISNVLPPKILMAYNGKEYDTGNLFGSKYREGISFSQLQIPQEKITSHLPNNTLTITNGSCLGFVVQNDPLHTPSSISVDAYNEQGHALKVLSLIENSKRIFFNIDLNEGKYIILVVATWLPASQKVTGYVEYVFVVDVKSNG
jgi:hypothetical protein